MVNSSAIAVAEKEVAEMIVPQMNTTVQGLMTVQGTITVQGTVTVQGLMTVQGTVTVQGLMTVQGTITVQGTVSVQGSVTVEDLEKTRLTTIRTYRIHIRQGNCY